MEIKIKGNFKKLIFSNNSNFFVYSFKIFSNQKEEKNLLDIGDTSYINLISKTNDIDFLLDYEVNIKKEIRPNSKYKISYFVHTKEIIVLNEDEAVIRFLSSSLFKGISSKSATKLVNELGPNFIDKIDKFENQVKSIVGNNKAKIIIETLNNKNEFNELSKIFISENLSISILNYLNESKKTKLKDFFEKNIFDLVEEDVFFDFNEIEKIAKRFFLNYSIELSNKYLILFEINKLENLGSTVNQIEDIFNNINQYRLIDIDEFKNHLKILLNENKIIIHENKKSLTSYKMYQKEKFICKQIKNLAFKNLDYKINKKEIIVDKLDENQQEAIIKSLNNNFSIITGGPGTGKTLLIDLIIKNLKKLGIKNIELLAPTGKAATQISFRTNESAKTFHSFLKWNQKTFEVNKTNPSDAEIIIIDEFSMIDINLLYSLLIACPRLKHLIVVGDKDQLPSIGPGYLLNDFIDSNKFNVTALEKIYRQSEGSLISKNSVLIKNNIFPFFDDNESQFIDIESLNFNINEILEKDIKKHLNSNYDLLDYQILIPMYNGKFGIDEINNICQKYINENKNYLFKINEKIYFKNDKVIQLENDNNKNIFNGEIGLISDVKNKEDKLDEIDKIFVEFSNKRIVEYSPSEFTKNIKLAYAISIHKFQGSECSNVLLILAPEHQSMLTKKLFYTAYTRAKKEIKIISSKKLIQKSIDTDFDSFRKCNILKFLNDL